MPQSVLLALFDRPGVPAVTRPILGTFSFLPLFAEHSVALMQREFVDAAREASYNAMTQLQEEIS